MSKFNTSETGYPSKWSPLDFRSYALEANRQLPSAIYKQMVAAVELARQFNEVALLHTPLEIDRKVMEDNDHIPEEFLRKANEWGLFTQWIPKPFGGQGMDMLSMYAFVEELASVCVGLANLIGVHYLGVTVLCASGNVRLINRILRRVVKESKTGWPYILALGWTEPNAGSDQVESPLLPGASVRTSATRVSNGYTVNGAKVFISNGHVASCVMLMCYEDVHRPADSLLMLAVPAGTKGFSLGRKENKMGQKACMASELIFDDCFVPDTHVCFSPDLTRQLGVPHREATARMIGMFPAVSQPGVGAMGAGMARAACVAAISFASRRALGGRPLIHDEWAQMIIADMLRNALAARTQYIEAACTVGMKSMIQNLYKRPLYALSAVLPTSAFTAISPLF